MSWQTANFKVARRGVFMCLQLQALIFMNGGASLF